MAPEESRYRDGWHRMPADSIDCLRAFPFDWKKDFGEEYLREIRYDCLVMSERYIRRHFDDIKRFANVIEERVDDEWLTMEAVLGENDRILEECRSHGLNYIWIDESYQIDLEL